MTVYWRPIPSIDPSRESNALRIADGWCHFDRVERMERGKDAMVVGLADVPEDVLQRISAPRSAIAGLSAARPQIMGIVNVTPDSFSDGGRFDGAQSAIREGRAMVAAGADILDIGGESTRPGAKDVMVDEEIARTAPVVEGLADLAPVSIDTRKARVAEAALNSGAQIVNDVSALTYDVNLGAVAAVADVPVCLMHAQGAPENMQNNPSYDDVVLDVYDGLQAAIDRAQHAGIKRENLIVDPGIGFGKTLEHNLALLRRLSIFHTLGLPVLLGASRKRFIGTITGEKEAGQRLAGSLAIAQHAVLQAVQIIRVHDTKATREVLDMTRVLINDK